MNMIDRAGSVISSHPKAALSVLLLTTGVGLTALVAERHNVLVRFGECVADCNDVNSCVDECREEVHKAGFRLPGENSPLRDASTLDYMD